MLEELNIPVAYKEFDGEPPELPFITFKTKIKERVDANRKTYYEHYHICVRTTQNDALNIMESLERLLKRENLKIEREMLVSWIKGLGPSDHEYVVLIDGTDELIGECSLTEQGNSAEIGFMLLPKYWHQGYGTEVVNSLIEKTQAMKIKELTATTNASNKAAIHLLAKCGFQKQKTGWMVTLPEDADGEVSDSQDIIMFRREIKGRTPSVPTSR